MSSSDSRYSLNFPVEIKLQDMHNCGEEKVKLILLSPSQFKYYGEVYQTSNYALMGWSNCAYPILTKGKGDCLINFDVERFSVRDAQLLIDYFDKPEHWFNN